LTSQKIWIIMW